MPDKRKTRRRQMRYSAWAHDGEVPHGCVVVDISDTGARLDVEHPDMIPETFTLLFTKPGTAKRFCRVVWRSEGQVGVVFEQQAPKPRSKLLETEQA